jgi:site-specific recombinase XerC
LLFSFQIDLDRISPSLIQAQHVVLVSGRGVYFLTLGIFDTFFNKKQVLIPIPIPLFLSKRNKRLSPRTLHDVFQKAADSLDIDKHLHAHLWISSFSYLLNSTIK